MTKPSGAAPEYDVCVCGHTWEEHDTPACSCPRGRPSEDALARLREACKAALVYDEAIQRAAATHGKSWVGVNEPEPELDKLYEDWIDKARAALAPEGPAKDKP